jgi:ribosomal protein S18 acetylase RimI-like enzyme
MIAKTTENADEFVSAAGEWLSADPVGNTIILGMTAGLRYRPPGAPAITLCWVTDQDGAGGQVVGAAVHSAPYLALLTEMPPSAAAALADEMAVGSPRIAGVLAPTAVSSAFAERWSRTTGTSAREGRKELVFVLDTPPVLPERPAPAGQSRTGGEQDLDLVTEWLMAAAEGSLLTKEDARRTAQRQLAGGLIKIWEDDAGPAAIVGWTAPVAGVVRFGPFYAAPDRRRGGYVRALVAETLSELSKEGVTGVAYPGQDNVPVQKLLESFGFRPLRTMAEYHFE